MSKSNFLQKMVLKIEKPFRRNKYLQRVRRSKYTSPVLIASILLLFYGFATGYLQYGLATVGCLKRPVTASRFMAGYDYELPGEEIDGPNIFDEYYCTEQQAKDAGFHLHSWTETGKKETEAQRLKDEQNATFSPEKVDFKVYTPQKGIYGIADLKIMEMQPDDKEVFFVVKKGDDIVVSVREGGIPSGYQLCNNDDPDTSCEVVGKDTNGRVVTKETVHNARGDSISYGIEIDTTFINLEGQSDDFTNDALHIFNTLSEYVKDAK